MSFNTAFSGSTGQTVQVIGFGRRFVAYLIDSILLSVVACCLLFGFVFAIAPVSEGNESAMTGLNLLFQCLSFLIGAGYFVAFWATTGQTPGKMALGIKVISEDGSPVSWGKAGLRYLGYLLNSLAFSIGFIWAAFDAKRQGWHDKIAKTYVVPKETYFTATEPVTFVPSDSGGVAAVAVVLLSLIPVLILVSIVVIAILLLIGPVVGNVFSNIVQNLETPTP